MILATGGVAPGEISMRSRPAVLAAASASGVLRTPRFSPAAPITRSSGARIWALMLMRCVAKGFTVGSLAHFGDLYKRSDRTVDSHGEEGQVCDQHLELGAGGLADVATVAGLEGDKGE